MKTIELLSTAELNKLERQFTPPKNITESIMLRGIQAELADRPRMQKDRLESELEEAEHEVNNLKEHIEVLEQEVGEKDIQIQILNERLSKDSVSTKVEAALTPA